VNTPSKKPERESAEMIWQELMEGNARFVAGQPRYRDLVKMRRNLVESQHPKAIVLACSDSRVSPEIIFDQTLGALFVIRSAGNVEDRVAVGSIEYSVENLGTNVLVVLGHSRCGAVTAACLNQRMASRCLQTVVDKIHVAVNHVSVMPRDGLLEAAIKENVHHSVTSVLSASEMLCQLAKQGALTVIEAEYILETGCVVRIGQSPKMSSARPSEAA